MSLVDFGLVLLQVSPDGLETGLIIEGKREIADDSFADEMGVGVLHENSFFLEKEIVGEDTKLGIWSFAVLSFRCAGILLYRALRFL